MSRSQRQGKAEKLSQIGGNKGMTTKYMDLVFRTEQEAGIGRKTGEIQIKLAA